MVRLCVVAPTVNVQVGGSSQPVSCKPHLPHEQLKNVIQQQVLPKFVSAFLQSADSTAPDGSPLQSWLRMLATDMQRSIERHLQQQFSPDAPTVGGLVAGPSGSSPRAPSPAQEHATPQDGRPRTTAHRARPRSGRQVSGARSPLQLDPAADAVGNSRPKTAPSADPALRRRRQRGQVETRERSGSATGDEGGAGRRPPLPGTKSSKSLRAGLSYSRSQGQS